MELLNLFGALFNTNSRPDLNGGDMLQNKGFTTPTKKKKSSVSALTERFKADIDAIESHYGKLYDGQTIETTLQEFLTIAPRNRKRIEAYNGLVSELKKTKGVTLIITSRKTHG